MTRDIVPPGGRARRDPEKESVWLELAELDAGGAGFVEDATRRLALGERSYGDRWASVGLPQLIAELTEEAADLGAWGVLALQGLEIEVDLDLASRELVASALRAAILWGAYAHRALALARVHLASLKVTSGPLGEPSAS